MNRSWMFPCPVTLSLLLLGPVGAASPAQHASPRPGPPSPVQLDVPTSHRTVIGNGLGGFGGTLAPGDEFGSSVAPLGDFDQNGVPDLVVTAPGDADGGALWMLFLDRAGSVIGERKISDTEGGFTGDLDACGCAFRTVDRIGDVDGNGVTDLIVGSPHDYEEEGPGSAWVLRLAADGTVASHVRIGEASGGFVGVPDAWFGLSVSAIGDLDDDGVPDVALAVGAPQAMGAPSCGTGTVSGARGVVHLLFNLF